MKLVISIYTALVFLIFMEPKQIEKPYNSESLYEKLDTIKFYQQWNYTGKCKGYCNIYIGGGDNLKEINGKALVNNAPHYSIFVSCPSRIRLQKNKVYKFIAQKFIPDACSTPIDTVVNHQYYRLV